MNAKELWGCAATRVRMAEAAESLSLCRNGELRAESDPGARATLLWLVAIADEDAAHHRRIAEMYQTAATEGR